MKYASPFLVVVATSLSFAACSESTPAQTSTITGDAGADAGSSLASPASPCVDTIDSVYGDPGPLAPDPNARGTLLRCAHDTDLTKDALQTKLTSLGYKGKALTSGAHVYRVSYRTERGDAASSPGASSAAIYVPDAPRAAQLPVLIGARGSRGQAAVCAASKLDPVAEGVNEDYLRLVYPLVGAGYVVIIPDLAGYANYGAPGNPPSAYANAADVGKSTLDGGRALKNLFPGLTDKTVIVGHSQGGHSALASLALADSYGTAGKIVGVATYAPLWLSQRSWGAVLKHSVAVSQNLSLAQSAAGPVSVWYHYTQAELLDGPGEGKKLFAPGKQDAIKDFVDTTCWGAPYPKLLALGTYPDELFAPEFVNAVSFPATGLADCGTPLCEKWIARYKADRPRLTGTAAQIPILMLYGGKDDTLPPGRMQCAVDRLKEDKVNLTGCFEAEGTHQSILDLRSDYVSDWVGNVALGEPAPAACAAGLPQIEQASAPGGGCITPPTND